MSMKSEDQPSEKALNFEHTQKSTLMETDMAIGLAVGLNSQLTR